MTDRNPAQPRQPSPAPRDDRAGTDASAGRQPAGTAVRDRWWWSPTLAIVVGAVVVGYQLEAIRGPEPLWLNWVVAGLGVAAAVYGAITLWAAYRSR